MTGKTFTDQEKQKAFSMPLPYLLFQTRAFVESLNWVEKDAATYALGHMNRRSKSSQFVGLNVPSINKPCCSVAKVIKNVSINLHNNKLLRVYMPHRINNYYYLAFL